MGGRSPSTDMNFSNRNFKVEHMLSPRPMMMMGMRERRGEAVISDVAYLLNVVRIEIVNVA